MPAQAARDGLGGLWREALEGVGREARGRVAGGGDGQLEVRLRARWAGGGDFGDGVEPDREGLGAVGCGRDGGGDGRCGSRRGC